MHDVVIRSSRRAVTALLRVAGRSSPVLARPPLIADDSPRATAHAAVAGLIWRFQ